MSLPQQHRRRGVSFNAEPEFHMIDKIDTFYKDDLWYNAQELHRVEKHNMLTVRAVRRGRELDESLFCERGLEQHVSRQSLMERNERVVAVIQSVLDEQTRQQSRPEEDRDWFEIQRLASLSSRQSSRDALTRAKLDEEALQADNKPKRTNYFCCAASPGGTRASTKQWLEPPVTSVSSALMVSMASSTA